jgi:predicted RNase H-like HicB family nuclease
MRIMTIETTIRIWREGKHYIAHALPIDVSSAADTPELARAAVHEAIELFVATAREQGTLDEVLEECGYTYDGAKWTAPAIVDQQHDLVAV